MLKISDLMPGGAADSKILYAVNRKKKPGRFEARGPYQVLEVLQHGTQLTGTMNLEPPPKVAEIEEPLTSGNLLKAAQDCFGPLMETERKILAELGADHCAARTAERLFKDRLGKSAFLLRLGRHSGAESVTIEGHRDIKIMQGKDKKPRYQDHSTTLWLASEESKPSSNKGLLPFGWAVLEVMNAEDLR